MDNLPIGVQIHIRDYIISTDIDDVAAHLGNPCTGCPEDGAINNPDDDAIPVCYSCPLWGLRVDLAQLRLLRRLELGGISSDNA